MPPRTRRGESYILVDSDDRPSIVCRYLANRLYDAEYKTGADRTCVMCLDSCDCRMCATYLSCGHGPMHLQCVLSMRSAKCPICRA